MNPNEDNQDLPVKTDKLSTLTRPDNFELMPPMMALLISGGCKNKARVGDNR